jgi:hypothetical protein
MSLSREYASITREELDRRILVPMQDGLAFVVVLVAIVSVAVLAIRGMSAPGARRFGGGPGPGAAGAFHDMLIEDKRKAIELIAEEKTGYVDPESADDPPTTGKKKTDRP